MAHRPFTPRQLRQNAAFVAALRRTGNARLAARELNVHRATYTKRRAKCAAFATEWDMALVAASAAFRLAGGPRMPAAEKGRKGQGQRVRSSRAKSRGARDDSVPTPLDFARDERSQQNLRTKGGEPTIVRLANGRLQLRLAPPGRMTDAAEKTYLLALSASANIRLAAKAAGFAHSSFYRRALRHPAFAAQGKVALTIGYDRLEHLALAHAGAAMRGEGPDNAWQVAAGEMPMPPMSWDQAFHTLCQHRAIVRLGWEERTRPIAAPADPAQAFAALERTLDADARVRHYEATGRWHLPGEPELPRLPPLGLVTGWSGAATVKVTHNPGVPLFGGWRIDDWKKRKKAG